MFPFCLTCTSLIELEDRRGQGSCTWESAPENGFNFRQCPEGLCSDKVGSPTRNCTSRFTRCRPHYVLTEDSDRDLCFNGQWTATGHQCIRKLSRIILISSHNYLNSSGSGTFFSRLSLRFIDAAVSSSYYCLVMLNLLLL